MKDILIKILKYLGLLLLWGFIPFIIFVLSTARYDFSLWVGVVLSQIPILIVYSLSTRWDILSTKKRKILSFIAPINITFAILLILVGLFYYKADIEPRFMFSEKSDIEEQIGIEFPDYRELDRELTLNNRTLLNYQYRILIKMDYSQGDEFTQRIESEIKNKKDSWKKLCDDSYSFSNSGGDRNRSEDFELKINTKKKEAVLSYSYEALTMANNYYDWDE